ncbi:SHSP domain-containing protein [Caerostris extrusa]|uniref:SHSP domain-containing protein n=1 Tax=Caerostris extrusa TaxID=172846 RepID=A0AAV4M7C6_CAEEX|nr:SHSP domain-containing protein [Caerostris extrusa]
MSWPLGLGGRVSVALSLKDSFRKPFPPEDTTKKDKADAESPKAARAQAQAQASISKTYNISGGSSEPYPLGGVDSETKEDESSSTRMKDFQLLLYMRHFRVTDIIVKLKRRTILVDASHEEHVDEHGFVSRSMVFRKELPNNVLLDTIVVLFTGTGFLVIQAKKVADAEGQGDGDGEPATASEDSASDVESECLKGL